MIAETGGIPEPRDRRDKPGSVQHPGGKPLESPSPNDKGWIDKRDTFPFREQDNRPTEYFNEVYRIGDKSGYLVAAKDLPMGGDDPTSIFNEIVVKANVPDTPADSEENYTLWEMTGRLLPDKDGVQTVEINREWLGGVKATTDAALAEAEKRAADKASKREAAREVDLDGIYSGFNQLLGKEASFRARVAEAMEDDFYGEPQMPEGRQAEVVSGKVVGIEPTLIGPLGDPIILQYYEVRAKAPGTGAVTDAGATPYDVDLVTFVEDEDAPDGVLEKRVSLKEGANATSVDTVFQDAKSYALRAQSDIKTLEAMHAIPTPAETHKNMMEWLAQGRKADMLTTESEAHLSQDYPLEQEEQS